MNQQLQEAAKAYELQEQFADAGVAEKAFLAGAAYMQGQSAGVWVKASDRLPPEGVYHALYNGDHVLFIIHMGGFRILNYLGDFDDHPKLNIIKWLDESPTTGGESDTVNMKFPEFVSEQGWYYVSNFLQWTKPGEKEWKTTTELYTLYKLSRNYVSTEANLPLLEADRNKIE